MALWSWKRHLVFFDALIFIAIMAPYLPGLFKEYLNIKVEDFAKECVLFSIESNKTDEIRSCSVSKALHAEYQSL